MCEIPNVSHFFSCIDHIRWSRRRNDAPMGDVCLCWNLSRSCPDTPKRDKNPNFIWLIWYKAAKVPVMIRVRSFYVQICSNNDSSLIYFDYWLINFLIDWLRETTIIFWFTSKEKWSWWHLKLFLECHFTGQMILIDRRTPFIFFLLLDYFFNYWNREFI